MKKRFKLIPFLISLLLVVGITFAICWYSFYGYKLNRIKFYDDYFHKSDYKDVETLKKYINDKGKILPRRVTGACARHQRHIAQQIKRARIMGLLPYAK